MTPTREEVILVAREISNTPLDATTTLDLFGENQILKFARHFYEAGAAAAREPLVDVMDALETLLNRIELEGSTPLDWPSFKAGRRAIEREKAEPQVWSPALQTELVQKAVREAITEPQAQAGEPEVVASVYVAPSLEQECDYWGKLPPGRHELITLSAHREAMATVDTRILGLKIEIKVLDEAIAQKDAALDACVEALEEMLAAQRATNRLPETVMQAEAKLDRIRKAAAQVTTAIEQGKKARGV